MNNYDTHREHTKREWCPRDVENASAKLKHNFRDSSNYSADQVPDGAATDASHVISENITVRAEQKRRRSDSSKVDASQCALHPLKTTNPWC